MKSNCFVSTVNMVKCFTFHVESSAYDSSISEVVFDQDIGHAVKELLRKDRNSNPDFF